MIDATTPRESDARRTTGSPLRRQAGVGLVEVMIAVLVLAIGLLGIAALQAITLKNSGSSIQRTQAMVHVYGMADTLRANKSRLASFNTGGFTCSAQAEAAKSADSNGDVLGWLARLTQDVEPSACGSVNCPGGNTCTVQVRWDDSRGSAGASRETVGADIRM